MLLLVILQVGNGPSAQQRARHGCSGACFSFWQGDSSHKSQWLFDISLPIAALPSLQLLAALWLPALSLGCFALQPGPAGPGRASKQLCGVRGGWLAFKASYGSPQIAVAILAAPSSINRAWGQSPCAAPPVGDGGNGPLATGCLQGVTAAFGVSHPDGLWLMPLSQLPCPAVVSS